MKNIVPNKCYQSYTFSRAGQSHGLPIKQTKQNRKNKQTKQKNNKKKNLGKHGEKPHSFT